MTLIFNAAIDAVTKHFGTPDAMNAVVLFYNPFNGTLYVIERDNFSSTMSNLDKKSLFSFKRSDYELPAGTDYDYTEVKVGKRRMKLFWRNIFNTTTIVKVIDMDTSKSLALSDSFNIHGLNRKVTRLVLEQPSGDIAVKFHSRRHGGAVEHSVFFHNINWKINGKS